MSTEFKKLPHERILNEAVGLKMNVFFWYILNRCEAARHKIAWTQALAPPFSCFFIFQIEMRLNSFNLLNLGVLHEVVTGQEMFTRQTNVSQLHRVT